ncbi:MAG: type II CAAX endopeptidase family protein [Actinomycetota bacterium]|nr:type II CAAX endopeptidase family protein [Actinomycetota bacterium]
MDDRSVPWTIVDVAYALLFFILMITMGSLVFLVGRVIDLPKVVVPIVGTVVGYLLLVAAIWYFAILKRGATWKILGFKRFNLVAGAGLVVVWFFLVRIVSYFYVMIAERVGLEETEDIARQIPEVFGAGTTGFIIAVLMVVVLAPIVEELFFRGFLYQALRQRWGANVAIVASGVLFSLAHFSLYLLVPIAVIGFALAYLYERTDSLGPPIILHALNNLISVVVVYYGGVLPAVG